ncbi:DUF1853 family protein [Marinobacter sp. M1N3S26]|uniref:DUF1853 family protein n=1 Tax=Marinobacter sp. M1N3S26 TaxID=3382299 RepID=UPI00387B8C58
MSEPWRPANHLAWLCQAPQLLDSPETFPLRDHLPDDWPSRLAGWATDPENRPASLTEPAHPRLGYYFERLYECMLTELLGWPLLAKNLQVRDAAGRTLGELDFVVQNPHTGAVEHHEIAVKFYLGYPEPGQDTRWFGPNSRDRLDLKVGRLLEHQSRLGTLPEARALLADLGVDEPVMPRVFIPGYLFYPTGDVVSLPDFVPGNHLRGHWLYHGDTRTLDTRHWVPLHKPHWLGLWWQQEPPDAGLSSTALASVEEYRRPRLFAALEQAPDTGFWHETARTFVVPSSWPGQG